MELQFNKSVIPCMQTILRDTQVQEQTQEVRLSDGMPDIGKVLASWGQVIISGKQWHSAGIGISGGVMAWVLYAPEDGTEPRCVETWLPFQMKWDFMDVHEDGVICIQPTLYSVDGRSTSARKLMVRSLVSILAEAMIDKEACVYSSGEVPVDICLLKSTYPLQLSVEAGEKAFSLEDYTTLPESQPAIGKIMRYHVQPELTEQKILTDKIIFRGNMILHILYRGIDERLYSWDFEIPFSQFADLNKEYGNDSTAQICFAVTNLEVELGEGGTVRYKAGLTGQYKVLNTTMIDVVEDAYSPLRPVVLQGENLKLPVVLDTLEQEIFAEQVIDADASCVADVAYMPERVVLHVENDNITGELNGVFQTLYYDDNDCIQCTTSRWEDTWTMRASKEARVDTAILPCGPARATTNGMNMRLQSNMKMQAMTWSENGIPMVVGLEVGEVTQPDPNRPSLVLCRAGEEGLWNLAKRTGSTVDAIKKANNLEHEPDSKKLLLIPIT